MVALTDGDGVWAAGHGVDHTDHAQGARGHGRAAGAEHAVVLGGLCRCDAGGCGLGGLRGAVGAGWRRLCGRCVFEGEGAWLSVPLIQSKDHGHVVTCR